MDQLEITKMLNDLNIPFRVVEHPAAMTIEEIDRFALPNSEAIAKNLFVRDDKKKNYYLITVRKDKKVDLKELRRQLNSRPLSFASENDLKFYLGLNKGAVTPLGILNQFGSFVQNKFPVKDEHIADGFISSTLFVCVGAMSIVGGIESGTQGTYQVFLAKTFIDSIVIFVMSATKGIGCCLSAFVALIYQTLITVSAGGIAQIISDLAITQMSVVGSLVIAGIALNLMNITKIKIGNFILCPFIPAFLSLGEKLLTLI